MGRGRHRQIGDPATAAVTGQGRDVMEKGENSFASGLWGLTPTVPGTPPLAQPVSPGTCVLGEPEWLLRCRREPELE